LTPQGCLLHLDGQPTFYGNLARGVFEPPRPAVNGIVLLDRFHVSNRLILLSRCPRFFDLRRSDALDFARMCFSARIITENGAALLPFEATVAVRTSPRPSVLFRFLAISEECKIAAAGRAVNFRFSRNRVPNALV
jgi:hypothetical protein